MDGIDRSEGRGHLDVVGPDVGSLDVPGLDMGGPDGSGRLRRAEPFAVRVTGLEARDGRLWFRAPGVADPVAVTVRYLRPLSARTEIVLLDTKQREVLTAVGVEAFSGDERALVETALAERYHMPRIERVRRIDVQFGTRYWEVETDRGPRWFALKEPGKNVTWLDEDRLILRDTAGNRYEIVDLGSLDAHSRRVVRLTT